MSTGSIENQRNPWFIFGSKPHNLINIPGHTAAQRMCRKKNLKLKKTKANQFSSHFQSLLLRVFTQFQCSKVAINISHVCVCFYSMSFSRLLHQMNVAISKHIYICLCLLKSLLEAYLIIYKCQNTGLTFYPKNLHFFIFDLW